MHLYTSGCAPPVQLYKFANARGFRVWSMISDAYFFPGKAAVLRQDSKSRNDDRVLNRRKKERTKMTVRTSKKVVVSFLRIHESQRTERWFYRGGSETTARLPAHSRRSTIAFPFSLLSLSRYFGTFVPQKEILGGLQAPLKVNLRRRSAADDPLGLLRRPRCFFVPSKFGRAVPDR